MKTLTGKLMERAAHQTARPMSYSAREAKSSVSLIYFSCELVEFLQGYLASSEDFHLLHWYSFGQAMRSILCSATDVVVIEFRGLDPRAIKLAQELKRLRHNLPIIMLADQPGLDAWCRAFQSGSDGLFVLPGTPRLFDETLRSTIEGWKPFPKEVQTLIVQRIAHLLSIA